MNLEHKFLWGCASLSTVLLSTIGGVVWNKLDAMDTKVQSHDGRIDKVEVRQDDDRDLLHEMRGDIKELLRRTDKDSH